MKKLIAALCAAVLACAALLTGCKGSQEVTPPAPTPRPDTPNAPEGAQVTLNGGDSALISGRYRLDFVGEDNGSLGVRLVDLNRMGGSVSELQTADAIPEAALFENAAPAKLNVRGADMGLLGSYRQTDYSGGYSSAQTTRAGYLLTADVGSAAGSRFRVYDHYFLPFEGVFGLERRVEVVSASAGDAGFSSGFEMFNARGSSSYRDFEYFIPGILYKDTEHVVQGAVASNLDLDTVYVKETRAGTPMVMARDKSVSGSLAIGHYRPEVSANGLLGGGGSGEIDARIQYGSLGVATQPAVGVGYAYPCAEGPTTYDNGAGWTRRYHPVEAGFSHGYRLSLIPGDDESYNDAMVSAFQKQFSSGPPELYEVDLDVVEKVNMEIFSEVYREYGAEGKAASAGMPWSLDVPDANNREGYSFQMGFVGQQIPVGYHMLRYGYMHSDPSYLQKAKRMLDFWASPVIMSNALPVVWWDPADNSQGGQPRGYPCFLRCFVDGMEGMLDAYRVSVAYGDPQTAWLNAAAKTADFLVSRQNADGSFYRAYRADGSVETSSEDNRTQGASKLNTPVAVRYLAKMYELYVSLGDYSKAAGYRAAAIAAAEFSYTELYEKLGKYVGGTPDNPNTVDKEAAVYAMYGFNAAYLLTGEEKYLKAAEHAAVCALSWTYTYDFAVPAQNEELAAVSPFTEGGTSGFSIIATGHSGADNFISYVYYELFKLYVLTGEEFYFDASLFVQNNSKQCMDWDGRLGYKYPALMPEASNVSDFNYSPAGGKGVWLPWNAVACLEPMVNAFEAFGDSDVRELKELGRETLLRKLDEYGAGGKPHVR